MLNILHKISDHGDALISKAVHHFGVYVGIGGGGAVAVAGKTLEGQISPIAQFVLEWGGLVTMLAGVSLIVKNLIDGYANFKENQRKQAEHDKKMGE